MLFTRRRSLLLTALFALAVVALSGAFRQHRKSALLESEFTATLERQANESVRIEREQIDKGRVWVGELHESLDGPPGPPTSAIPDRASRRLFGLTQFEDCELSVTLELHECDPGSRSCTSGGNIDVNHGDRIVCSISVGLLQVTDAGRSSNYRVNWHSDEAGRPLENDAKLRILRQLAGGRLASNRAAFHGLMQSAYRNAQRGNVDDDANLRRAIVRTIFNAIIDSRGVSSTGAHNS